MCLGIALLCAAVVNRPTSPSATAATILKLRKLKKFAKTRRETAKVPEYGTIPRSHFKYNGFEVTTATTVEEAKQAISAGFEYITEKTA